MGFVYWCALFPVNIQVDTGTNVTIKWVRAIWLHTINPLVFLIFCISSFYTNQLTKIPLGKMLGYAVIYPIAYGVLIYTIPFMIQATVYGCATNINPYMILPPDYLDTSIQTPEGDPWWILLSIVGIIAICGVMTIINSIDNKINDKLQR